MSNIPNLAEQQALRKASQTIEVAIRSSQLISENKTAARVHLMSIHAMLMRSHAIPVIDHPRIIGTQLR